MRALSILCATLSLQIHPESAFGDLPALYVGDLRDEHGMTSKGRAASRWQKAETIVVHKGDKLADVIAHATDQKEVLKNGHGAEEEAMGSDEAGARRREQAQELQHRLSQQHAKIAAAASALTANIVIDDSASSNPASAMTGFTGGGEVHPGSAGDSKGESKCPFAAMLAVPGGEEALRSQLSGKAGAPSDWQQAGGSSAGVTTLGRELSGIMSRTGSSRRGSITSAPGGGPSKTSSR